MPGARMAYAGTPLRASRLGHAMYGEDFAHFIFIADMSPWPVMHAREDLS